MNGNDSQDNSNDTVHHQEVGQAEEALFRSFRGGKIEIHENGSKFVVLHWGKRQFDVKQTRIISNQNCFPVDNFTLAFISDASR